MSAAWAAIGIATAIGAGLAEGLSFAAVSGIVVNALLAVAATLAAIHAPQWRWAILTAAVLVTIQKIGVVIGFGGATDTIVAALLALVAIAGATLAGLSRERR